MVTPRPRRLGAALAVTLLVTLVGSLLGPAAPATAVDYKPGWGRTYAPDQPLRAGCHAYRYRYRVMVAGDNWSAEIFLRNRRGVGIASHALDSGADARRGWRSFRICRPATVYGRHRIRIKITNCDGLECTEAWGRTSYFRLYRPR